MRRLIIFGLVLLAFAAAPAAAQGGLQLSDVTFIPYPDYNSIQVSGDISGLGIAYTDYEKMIGFVVEIYIDHELEQSGYGGAMKVVPLNNTIGDSMYFAININCIVDGGQHLVQIYFYDRLDSTTYVSLEFTYSYDEVYSTVVNYEGVWQDNQVIPDYEADFEIDFSDGIFTPIEFVVMAMAIMVVSGIVSGVTNTTSQTRTRRNREAYETPTLKFTTAEDSSTSEPDFEETVEEDTLFYDWKVEDAETRWTGVPATVPLGSVDESDCEAVSSTDKIICRYCGTSMYPVLRAGVERCGNCNATVA